MKLSEHFKSIIKEAAPQSRDAYEELLPKLKEYENVFQNGIGKDAVTVDKDLNVYYFGDVEFNKNSYVDGEGKLPFKFVEVHGRFVLERGYADKLKTLEGLPTKECQELHITLETHKPPSFFEKHFPKKVDRLDLECVSLQNCDFGIERITKVFELTVEEFGLKSFSGMPDDVLRISCNFPPSTVRSFNGIPKKLGALQFWIQTGENQDQQFTLGDLVEHAEYIESISTSQHDIAPNTPMLSLFKIKGLKRLGNNNILVTDCHKVFKIVDKHLANGDVFECQDELEDSGFGEFAKA